MENKNLGKWFIDKLNNKYCVGDSIIVNNKLFAVKPICHQFARLIKIKKYEPFQKEKNKDSKLYKRQC